MKKIRLGEMSCNGVPVFMDETAGDTLALNARSSFKVALSVRGQVLDMNLQDVLGLKRLLYAAERRLLLREEQVFKSCNRNLEL